MLVLVHGPDPRLLWRASEAARAALGGEPITSLVASTTGRVSVRATSPHRQGVAVKVYRDPERLLQERVHSRLARDLGLPIPQELLFEVGPPAVLVTEWIDGEPVDRHPAAARGLGQLLARYYVSREPPPGAEADWAEHVTVRRDSELRRLNDMALLGETERDHVAQNLDELVAAVGHRPQTLIHGDLQPEHVLVEPLALRIVAIVDWADSGFADPLFEAARLSLLNPELEDPFLAGVGIATDSDLMRGYRILWSVISATWLAERGLRSDAARTVGDLRAQLAR